MLNKLQDTDTRIHVLDGSILFVEQVYCDQLLCGYRVCINSWSKNLTVIMTALIVVYATTGTGSCSKASFYW